MPVALIIVTILDLALGALLVAVSGFILQGVNNTGPIDGAAYFVLMMILCPAAALASWVLRRRIGEGWAVGLALVPLVLGAVALMLPA